MRSFANSGAVAGLYARTDAARGLWKALPKAIEGASARAKDMKDESTIGDILSARPDLKPLIASFQKRAEAEAAGVETHLAELRDADD